MQVYDDDKPASRCRLEMMLAYTSGPIPTVLLPFPSHLSVTLNILYAVICNFGGLCEVMLDYGAIACRFVMRFNFARRFPS